MSTQEGVVNSTSSGSISASLSTTASEQSQSAFAPAKIGGTAIGTIFILLILALLVGSAFSKARVRRNAYKSRQRLPDEDSVKAVPTACAQQQYPHENRTCEPHHFNASMSKLSSSTYDRVRTPVMNRCMESSARIDFASKMPGDGSTTRLHTQFASGAATPLSYMERSMPFAASPTESPESVRTAVTTASTEKLLPLRPPEELRQRFERGRHPVGGSIPDWRFPAPAAGTKPGHVHQMSQYTVFEEDGSGAALGFPSPPPSAFQPRNSPLSPPNQAHIPKGHKRGNRGLSIYTAITPPQTQQQTPTSPLKLHPVSAPLTISPQSSTRPTPSSAIDRATGFQTQTVFQSPQPMPSLAAPRQPHTSVLTGPSLSPLTFFYPSPSPTAFRSHAKAETNKYRSSLSYLPEYYKHRSCFPASTPLPPQIEIKPPVPPPKDWIALSMPLPSLNRGCSEESAVTSFEMPDDDVTPEEVEENFTFVTRGSANRKAPPGDEVGCEDSNRFSYPKVPRSVAKAVPRSPPITEIRTKTLAERRRGAGIAARLGWDQEKMTDRIRNQARSSGEGWPLRDNRTVALAQTVQSACDEGRAVRREGGSEEQLRVYEHAPMLTGTSSPMSHLTWTPTRTVNGDMIIEVSSG